MGAVKLFSRNALPDDLAAKVSGFLGRRPRILAWGRTENGAVVALHDRLVHVVGDDSKTNREQLRGELAGMLEERFGIEHATLQVEAVPCGGHGVHA